MTKKTYTGVTLDPDVLTYLAELGKREDRNRSWLINAIVREHAGRHAELKPTRSTGALFKKKK